MQEYNFINRRQTETKLTYSSSNQNQQHLRNPSSHVFLRVNSLTRFGKILESFLNRNQNTLFLCYTILGQNLIACSKYKVATNHICITFTDDALPSMQTLKIISGQLLKSRNRQWTSK
ncbi:Hypothetical_protein [Hexamita inflata]|uniref:Hypothetical_protein n=1 Tax=Hexamita inflata TaxID=28002 RepID=A0AA86N9Z1_9EUKA|nr:Hypothetical protein HINF_LOCUS3459 [Hexamita inflata]CAI9925491.1 Hypothetical protein HINF_LOCUS13136 [Hexamita inflata]CAI9967503.1 Hypothetical protein HINF_LOCUS55148 [Hexamita inflata]CAI9967504.1 Hypothetical protein HINF_LOCUS55149 [Hexamita inflata]CAI9967505.1 Hypothetical protein HINF_LOCUS55150 [Hexamita inflata]